jgi:hypothetical protein
MNTTTFKEAKNLGKEAHMNKLECVPFRDKQLMELVQDKTLNQVYLHFKEWIAGWNEVHIKEINAGFDFSTLFNQTN